MIDRSPERLFRAHVARRAQNLPGVRYRTFQSCSALARFGWEPLGKTEIKHFDLVSCSQGDVRGLDVAVYNLFFVCGIQCVGDLNPVLNYAVDIQWAVAKARI